MRRGGGAGAASARSCDARATAIAATSVGACSIDAAPGWRQDGASIVGLVRGGSPIPTCINQVQKTGQSS
jgi:hypothetical protein